MSSGRYGSDAAWFSFSSTVLDGFMTMIYDNDNDDNTRTRYDDYWIVLGGSAWEETEAGLL